MGTDYDYDESDTDLTPEELHRLLGLADIALKASLVEDWEIASRACQVIANEFGPSGLTTAMIAWSDTLIGAVPWMEWASAGQTSILKFFDAQTGIVSSAEGIPPDVVWAGRVVTARSADDKEMFIALLETVPAEEFGDWVGRFLELCAHNLRAGLIATRIREKGDVN